ncbi:MAG: hypothetical protein ABIZ80_19050 [Bryobacteraceae bacterium]
MLDLRTPTGWFFVLVGLTLCCLGLFFPSQARLTDANVNLYSGMPMLAFGAILLVLTRVRPQ